MQMIMEFLKSDIMLIAMPVVSFLMIILYILNNLKLRKIQKNYDTFLNKIGNSTNIEEDLRNYIEKVENVEKDNKQISTYCREIEENMKDCIQKIGIVRYTAFEDIGSDLSFALAMLDEKNNGVILNGIYSSDMSNIYAKPIKNGQSTYTLSEQEKQALDKAMGIVKV